MSVDIPQNTLSLTFKSTIRIGDVFLKCFEGISHPKFFIITGISQDRVTVCSVFINSKIHPSLFNKPILFNAQIPLKKDSNSFLSHDSYANCSHTFILDLTLLAEDIANDKCKVIGTLNNDDIISVRRAIIDTGLLSHDTERTFFNDLLQCQK